MTFTAATNLRKGYRAVAIMVERFLKLAVKNLKLPDTLDMKF